MSIHSAGILVYRIINKELQVLLVHPGGPFWSKKDAGAWSIPKGILEENEDPLETAKREFKEETGFNIKGKFIELGQLKQPSRKIIYAWAIEGNFDVSKLKSNTFALEWPKNSGNIKEYPEIDKAEWFNISIAMNKMLKGQRDFLTRLIEKINYVWKHKEKNVACNYYDKPTQYSLF
jgi:predicted NUDIX family NTP pyrophosphohydrolase